MVQKSSDGMMHSASKPSPAAKATPKPVVCKATDEKTEEFALLLGASPEQVDAFFQFAKTGKRSTIIDHAHECSRNEKTMPGLIFVTKPIKPDNSPPR